MDRLRQQNPARQQSGSGYKALYHRLIFNLITVVMLFNASVTGAVAETRSKEEIIPLTEANIRGHKKLYNEGWGVITSTDKAFKYVKQNSITSSAEALRQMKQAIKQDTAEFKEEFGTGAREGVETSKSIFEKGTKRSAGIFSSTHKLGKRQLAYSKSSYIKAWDKFSTGYLTYGDRTADDLEALKAIPGDYYNNLNDDFSNIARLSKKMNDALSTDIRADWPGAMHNANEAFMQEYEKSAESGSSFGGLWHIVKGYGKSAYHAVVKPSVQTTFMVGEYTLKTATQAVFLPVSAIAYVSGRTVQSTGLTLYYTGKGVVKFVSPTVVGGFYAATASASALLAPVTYTAGATAGVVNQVVSTVGAPVVGAAEGVGKTAYETIKYPMVVTYDVAVGATKVVVNQLKSGVVLGYNALTAIPAHTLMAVPNSMIFLFWDGPRLVVAYAKGEVENDQGEGVNINNLPTGTMVDVDSLKKSDGIVIEEITDDPEVIKNIIERLPDDLINE